MPHDSAIDWNWFFAAFAQCGAALIGIIAAFIISKLLNESEKADNLSQRLESSIVSYNDIKNRIATRHFNWYNKKNIEYSSSIKKAIENGTFENLDKNEQLEKLYSIEPKLYKNAGNIINLRKRIREVNQQKGSFASIGLGLIIPRGLWNHLDEEKELINTLKIEGLALIENFKLLENELKNTQVKLKPINYTILVLSIGFIFTVIYPLHFMPLPVGNSPQLEWAVSLFFTHLFSLKGVLLLLLTAVIEGVLIYFLILTRTLKFKYSKTTEEILDDYVSIEGYSSYFG